MAKAKKAKSVDAEYPKPVECGKIDGFKKFKMGALEYLVVSEGKGYRTTIDVNKYNALTLGEKKALKAIPTR